MGDYTYDYDDYGDYNYKNEHNNSTSNGSDGNPIQESHNNNALTAARITVCIIGLLGNILVIFVILRLREYKKAITHWYVLQLALADSIFLLTLPFKVVEDYNDEWIFSGGMCKAKETVLFLNYYSSVLFLMVMSIDRYVSVCHSLSDFARKVGTKRASQIISLLVWVSSLLFCIPVMIFSDKMGEEPNCRCQYEFPVPIKSPKEKCAEHAESLGMTLTDCIEFEKKTHDDSLCRNVNESQWSSLLVGNGGPSGVNPDYNMDYATTGVNSDYNMDDATTDDYTSAGRSLPNTDYAVGSGLNESSPYNGLGSGTNGTEGNIGAELGGNSNLAHYVPECCYNENGHGWKAFLLFNFIVMFIVPVIVMSVCYSLIACKLAQTGSMLRRRGNSSPGTSTKRQRSKSAAAKETDRKRRRITITCFSLVVVFIVCWLPFHSVHLAKMVGIAGRTAEFCATLGAAVSVVAYCNSALNPIIYNFIGMDFRKRLKKAATSLRSTTRSRSSKSSSDGGPTVRFKKNKNRSTGSNSATATTKIYTKGSSQASSSVDDKAGTSEAPKVTESQKPLI